MKINNITFGNIIVIIVYVTTEVRWTRCGMHISCFNIHILISIEKKNKKIVQLNF